MYELVSVPFPFANDALKAKPRPGFVISAPFGVRHQVVVAYVTTSLDELLETDVVLDGTASYFSSTGLITTSVIKLHRLGTFEPEVLKVSEGCIPEELIPQVKEKLKIIFAI